MEKTAGLVPGISLSRKTSGHSRSSSRGGAAGVAGADGALVAVDAGCENFSQIGGVDALESLKAHGAHLHCPAAPDQLVVKGNGDAGDAAVHGGKGGIEVVAGVGEQVVDGHLGAGEDYGFGEILEHVAQHRGGVSHGISAVGDDDAVIGVQIFHHRPGDGLPLLSLDVGAVQVEDVPGVDVVVGAQVRHIFQQAPGRDLGLQSLVAPAGGDGAPVVRSRTRVMENLLAEEMEGSGEGA